jgi:hypothetical protein
MFVHTQSEQSLQDSSAGEGGGEKSAVYRLPIQPGGGEAAVAGSWLWASFRTRFLTWLR